MDKTYKNRYKEKLYDGYHQELQIKKILYEKNTNHQHLMIFENPLMGRVLALDGVIQTTEADEFIYHEMLTHVPIFLHGGIKKVLILGGGDGGILREVVKHSCIESIRMVEIDSAVVDICRRFLPKHSSGAYEDPRLCLNIDEGMSFLGNTTDTYDLIISDSTDPIREGKKLFSEMFYQSCANKLNVGGIFVAQNGIPFMQLPQLINTSLSISKFFTDWHFYQAAIPTYIGGSMAFAWGSVGRNYRKTALKLIQDRFLKANFLTKYYNPELSLSSFVLPQYILKAIGKVCNE